MRVEERFWDKVNKSDECWVWTAATNSKGYVKLPVDTLVRLIGDPDLTADFIAAYAEAREAQS